jgi:DNA end-binding protein Ku
MARPYWKGYLKLSLVTCQVNMSPATSESEKVRFHTLNKEKGQPGCLAVHRLRDR